MFGAFVCVCARVTGAPVAAALSVQLQAQVGTVQGLADMVGAYPTLPNHRFVPRSF